MGKPNLIINSWEVIQNQASRNCIQPAVTVLISLYNYAAFIRSCLDSVRASKTDGLPGGFEVVLVDDASTDTSVKVVEQYMADHDLPVCLVKKIANSGLTDTRNIGLHVARAPLVFILDADNEIRPDCLLAHYQALAGSVHAMAYGIINRFDSATRQSLGTMSHSEWDERKLVSQPYIDAMAMIKREIVLKLGGYSVEQIPLSMQGWEDYDLWLKLAQAGYSGKMIPQILSDYRVHSASMLQKILPFHNRFAWHFTRKFHALTQRHTDLPTLFGIPRSELTLACLQGVALQYLPRDTSPQFIHRFLGDKMRRSICKRLIAAYNWFHP